MSLPIIDISTLRQNGRSVSPEVLTAIRQAYTEYGFFYITEHGIPEAIIHAAAQSALHFFQLPVEKKVRYRQMPPIVVGMPWAMLGCMEQRSLIIKSFIRSDLS